MFPPRSPSDLIEPSCPDYGCFCHRCDVGSRRLREHADPLDGCRADVQYATREPRGTIVVDPLHHYLYYVEGGGQARRYGIAVGGEGFGWSGVAMVHSKQEWPDWYPTKEILERHPELTAGLKELPGGQGVPGGPDSPLGARALYLWQGNKDTLYRIHGTNEPWKIGSNVSSGCIRMINDDVIDLYDRVGISTKVVVLASNVG